MFQTKMYVKELLDYLNTVTIKNELIANQMYDIWVADEFKDILPQELHPYYRNITGDYILKDLSAIEPLLGIDKRTLTAEQYKSLQPEIEYEAYNRYGLSIRTTINGVSYLNSSIYTKFNDLVILNSLDNQELIPLTKKIATDLNHVKTIASYKIPNLSFYTLCDKYPNSAAIIKAILYPIPDQYSSVGLLNKTAVQTAIEADNFTLLFSDERCLEEQERTSIIDCLNKTLTYIRTRWGVKEFAFEDLYACAHESIVWDMLFLALIVQRINNIKTYSAHSYHIWEYIKSNGFGDYRTVLNRQQTLFLYKNLSYLIFHKGTEKVLELLSYVFLMPWNIRLDNKILAQQPEDMFKELPAYKESGYAIPTVISKRVGSSMFAKLDELLSSQQIQNISYQQLLIELEKVAGKDYNSINDLETDTTYESLKVTLDKERESGIEYQNDNLFERSLEAQNKAFSITPHNLLKTKLLEIKSPAGSVIFETLYARFVTQQILYRSSTNSLKFAITFMPAVSDTFITLTANEAIALLMYSISRENGYVPELPPTWAHITMAYKQDIDLTTDIIQRFKSVTENKYSAFILKPNSHEYGFNVTNSIVNGLYLPHTSYIWMNANDNSITLEYSTRNVRWEFKQRNRVLLYSSSIRYIVKNIIGSGLPWDVPIYWYNLDATRSELSIDKVYNPTIPVHYKLANELYAHPTAYTSVESFSESIHNQAKSYVSMFAEAGYSASNEYVDFLYALHNKLIVKDVVNLNLLKGASYNEFFTNDKILRSVIDNIEISDKPKEAYAKLSSAILDSLFPITDSIKLDPVYTINQRYKLLKELFISMCSYNVAFLTSTRVDATPYTIPRISSQYTKMKYNVKYYEGMCNDRFKMKVNSTARWTDMSSMVVREYI